MYLAKNYNAAAHPPEQAFIEMAFVRQALWIMAVTQFVLKSLPIF